MLKLKLQYFGHLMWKADSLRKTLMLGKTEGRRRSGWQRMRGWHHWLNGHEFEQTLGDSEDSDREEQGSLACCSPWGYKESDMTQWLNNNDKSHQVVLSATALYRSPLTPGSQPLLMFTSHHFGGKAQWCGLTSCIQKHFPQTAFNFSILRLSQDVHF